MAEIQEVNQTKLEGSIPPIKLLRDITDPQKLIPNRHNILIAFARTRRLFANLMNQIPEGGFGKKLATVLDIQTYDFLPDQFKELPRDEKIKFLESIALGSNELLSGSTITIRQRGQVSEHIKRITQRAVEVANKLFYKHTIPNNVAQNIRDCSSAEELLDFIEGDWIKELTGDAKLIHCGLIKLILGMSALEHIDQEGIKNLLAYFIEEFQRRIEEEGGKITEIGNDGSYIKGVFYIAGEVISFTFKSDQKKEVAILEKYLRKREYVEPQIMNDLARWDLQIGCKAGAKSLATQYATAILIGFLQGKTHLTENVDHKDAATMNHAEKLGIDYELKTGTGIHNLQITGKPNKNAPKVKGIKTVEIQVTFSDEDFNAIESWNDRTMYGKKRLQSALARYERGGLGIITVEELRGVIEEYLGKHRIFNPIATLQQSLESGFLIPLDLKDDQGNYCYAVGDIYKEGRTLYLNPPLPLDVGTRSGVANFGLLITQYGQFTKKKEPKKPKPTLESGFDILSKNTP